MRRYVALCWGGFIYCYAGSVAFITHLTGFKFLFNSGRLGSEILCLAGTIGVEGNSRPLDLSF